MTHRGLTVEGLAAGYVGRPRAIDGITFTVRCGEAVAVIGPSGAGKSTLFRTLARLAAPSAGRASLGELDLHDSRSRRALRGRIGLVHQQHAVPGALRADVAVLAGEMHGWSALKLGRTWLLGPSHEDRRRAAMMLERLGLAGREHELVSQLSIGQRQRVAVARTLLQAPGLVLADEPVAAVDPSTARTVLTALTSQVSTGAAVLCSVHEVSQAREYFERVIALKDGSIEFDGPSAKLTDALVERIYGGAR